MGLLSHDRKYFSEPMKFKPERWRKDGEETIRPFSCLPFGYGPRGCYGNYSAQTHLKSPHTHCHMNPTHHTHTCIQCHMTMSHAHITGRRLAELKLYTLLVKLISNYRLSTPKDTINITRNNGLYPTATVPITLTER